MRLGMRGYFPSTFVMPGPPPNTAVPPPHAAGDVVVMRYPTQPQSDVELRLEADDEVSVTVRRGKL